MQLRVIALAALVLGFIMLASVASFAVNQEEYYGVDELVLRAAPVKLDGRLQVRGEVDYATVERPREGLELHFVLKGQHGAVNVVYSGVVPDTFEMAEAVTVGGRLAEDGTFLADQLFVQCPSKYEALPPGAEHSSNRG